jgi:hypothetical protein
VQLESTEASLEVNGMTQNPEAAVEPDGSQMNISEHPVGEITEDASAWLECLRGEQSKAVGTSSHPPQQKDKVQIPSSPCKKLVAKIVLPCIPAGVQVGPELLAHVRKLKYSDHDVEDETKFPELVKRVFL